MTGIQHIQDHKIRTHDREMSESFHPITGDLDLVALEPQSSTNRVAERIIVINDHYPGRQLDPSLRHRLD